LGKLKDGPGPDQGDRMGADTLCTTNLKER
jgi:hypothetical protein